MGAQKAYGYNREQNNTANVNTYERQEANSPRGARIKISNKFSFHDKFLMVIPVEYAKTVNQGKFLNEKLPIKVKEVHERSSDSNVELSSKIIEIPPEQAPVKINFAARILFDCDYGAKSDDWCWTRFRLFIDEKLYKEQYFTRGHRGSGRVSELSTEITLGAGRHTISIMAYTHASRGDNSDLWLKEVQLSAQNIENGFILSNMHFLSDGKEYIICMKK